MAEGRITLPSSSATPVIETHPTNLEQQSLRGRVRQTAFSLAGSDPVPCEARFHITERPEYPVWQPGSQGHRSLLARD